MRSVNQSESIESKSIIFRRGLLIRKPALSSSVQEDRVINVEALEPINVSTTRVTTNNLPVN